MTTLTDMDAAISIQGLTKNYGRRMALRDLSLELSPGEIFGFLGPNGAGKSTTIRLLLDFIRPTAGRATVLGFDCSRQSVEVHRRTGYLPGELHLFPSMTGRGHAELIASLRGMSHLGRAGELADVLDLDLSREVRAYSKGNRQKLGLLLALMSRPAVLLLDEPTSGLDPIVQHTVWDLIREDAGNGTTVFFSSHVMGEVEEVCDRVGVLRAGTLVAVEPTAAWRAHQKRRVEVSFAGPAPGPETFLNVAGVREVERDHSHLEFEIDGEMDGLLKTLARSHVVDLRTHQPTLEELLLGYYRVEDA